MTRKKNYFVFTLGVGDDSTVQIVVITIFFAVYNLCLFVLGTGSLGLSPCVAGRVSFQCCAYWIKRMGGNLLPLLLLCHLLLRQFLLLRLRRIGHYELESR